MLKWENILILVKLVRNISPKPLKNLSKPTITMNLIQFKFAEYCYVALIMLAVVVGHLYGYVKIKMLK